MTIKSFSFDFLLKLRKINQFKYPCSADLAEKYVWIPASSAAAERPTRYRCLTYG